MISILDSTLREGEQTAGVYFDAHIKMAVAELLDEIGVDIIEAGHPVVTEEIFRGVRSIASRPFRALIGAHARSLKKDIDRALECGVGFVGIFYCVSEQRLRDHETTLSEATQRIVETIAYAKENRPGLLLRYTPEDTVRTPFKDVAAIAVEAVRAGADIISIADTTGFLIPGSERSMYEWVSRLREELARSDLYPRIAVHCHNDRGLALANALDGLRAGASIIDASVLGLGERAGIVDLATLLAVLATDHGQGSRWQLHKVPELYELISRYSGVQVPIHFPVVGKNAFTHCAGVHSQAVLKNSLHYQSLDPAAFGRHPEIVLDHMSGMSALQYSLEKIGEAGLDAEQMRMVLEKVKSVGQHGRTVGLDELRWIVRYQGRQLQEKSA